MDVMQKSFAANQNDTFHIPEAEFYQHTLPGPVLLYLKGKECQDRVEQHLFTA
jgi:hypothetical protein